MPSGWGPIWLRGYRDLSHHQPAMTLTPRKLDPLAPQLVNRAVSNVQTTEPHNLFQPQVRAVLFYYPNPNPAKVNFTHSLAKG